MEMNPRALDVLGDPTRRAIVDRLRRGPSPVGRLAEGMPVSRPAVSQHLTVLKTAGLVSEHREGTRRIYRLEATGIEELRRWVEALALDARSGSAAIDSPQSEAAGRATGTGRDRSRADRAAADRARVSDTAGVSAPGAPTKTDRPGGPKGESGKKKHGKKRAGKK